ncbi:guanylin [Amia ocellicauda]|uniref:guanylin n=1 Tax=Amia ocellicauda TaxID=2972642 RepID=UPI003463B73C
MKAFPVFLLCSCFVWNSQSVTVVDGNFAFPLDTVMQLKCLMDGDIGTNPRLAQTSAAVICANPALPEDFRPVCQSQGADLVFSRLAKVTTQPDLCEICANAACTGCL